MFNELKHDFYLSINDIKLELGLITKREHLAIKLQEEIRYNSVNFGEFVDDIVKTIGDYFDDLVNDFN